MPGIQVSVSWGEAIDKLTILAIKSERIKDPAKLLDVKKEASSLQSTIEFFISPDKEKALQEFQAELKTINEKLWDMEDQIREPDIADQSGQLAILIANTNDARFLAKAKINALMDSDYKEVKSHPGL